MPNMSYCRFQNTLEDLRDCYENIDVPSVDLSGTEARARLKLVKLCEKIVTACDIEDLEEQNKELDD